MIGRPDIAEDGLSNDPNDGLRNERGGESLDEWTVVRWVLAYLVPAAGLALLVLAIHFGVVPDSTPVLFVGTGLAVGVMVLLAVIKYVTRDTASDASR